MLEQMEKDEKSLKEQHNPIDTKELLKKLEENYNDFSPQTKKIINKLKKTA